jgi:hypothetical protein
MGDFLSISICNERGLRALLRDFRNPTFRRWRLRQLMRPDSRNRSHPLVVSTPALSPVFVRRGSDPFALPPFALRAELIAHLFAKSSVSTLEAAERTRPLLTYR